MSLYARVEPHHKQMYSDNVMQVAQQMKYRIRPSVTEVSAAGEAMSVADLIGQVDPIFSNPNDRRNVENVPQNSRRWLTFPQMMESGQYITTAEKLQRAMDPTAAYTTTHVKALVRGIDLKCLGVKKNSDGTYEVDTGGIMGGAVDGKNPGGATVALPSSCYTAASSTGLTLAKLKEAVERMRSDEFGIDDDDQIYAAITPKQVTDLLDIADGDGASLNAFQQLQLQNGKPTTLMGINWIITNALPVDSSGDRMCPFWTKSNIILGIWQDLRGDMWNDGGAKNTPYAHVNAYVDCVRVQDLGVHVVRCAE